MNDIEILELFAGIGACSTALKKIGIDLEIVDAVEIDKFAIASFNAIHNTNFETQDITEWNKQLKDIDLITHGSPCQDFSVAGKQAGGDIGSGTRSSLMYETIRIVGQVRPKYVLWENVKNILSKKHKHNFDAYIETMNILGYNSYYQVLNAKDYGIPQNRERVYTISIRKDIDKGNFNFPQKEELKLKLKDMLEDEVDEKYYINDGTLNNILSNNQAGFLSGGKWDKINESCRRYYKEDGISPSIHTCQGGNTEPKIITIGNYMPSNHDASRIVNNEGIAPTVKENHGTVTATNVCYIEKKYDEFVQEKGYIPEMFNPYNKTEIKDIAPSQTTQCGSVTSSATVLKNERIRIRKLTPKECWRLMGFSDEDFEKAANVPTSNTQLYKQAGNSIVVNVLEKIFENLFREENK